jgi:hypothetical protein
MNVNKLTEEAGNKDEAIKIFISKIKTNIISFPYQKYFLDNPLIMFSRLKKCVPKIIYRKNKIRAYYPYRKPIDCYYQGKPISIMSDTESYLKFDSISDHFCENIRIKAKRCDSISPLEFWFNENKMLDVLIEVFKNDIINPKDIRSIIYERVNEAKQFRPSWVKGIVKIIYPTQQNLKMIDISAGWGDRLISAISMNFEYLGFDPNKELMAGHSKIIETFGNKNRHKVIYKPFEEINEELKQNYYDICISSPPFFDLEKYSDDPTQSCVKYNQIKTWIEGFLFPSLQKVWNSIKIGGYMAIHLGDTYRFRICDPMNHYIDEFLPNSLYKGVIGILGERKRPTAVWIWQKNPTIATYKNPLFPYKFNEIYEEYINPNQESITLKYKVI